MWAAITRWNARRRRMLLRYQEAKRKYDAWPETACMVYALSTGPPVVVVVFKLLPFGLVWPIWILGGFGVAYLTKRFRESRRSVAGIDPGGPMPGRLFEVVAFVTFYPVGVAVMALARHNVLAWFPSIVVWVAESYLVSLGLWRIFRRMNRIGRPLG